MFHIKFVDLLFIILFLNYCDRIYCNKPYGPSVMHSWNIFGFFLFDKAYGTGPGQQKHINKNESVFLCRSWPHRKSRGLARCSKSPGIDPKTIDLATVMYWRYFFLGSCAFASAQLIAPVIDPILLSRVYFQISTVLNTYSNVQMYCTAVTLKIPII